MRPLALLFALLVLVLPARKEIYRNAALDRLVALCREAIFSVIREEPFHRLSFENWLEARLYQDDFPQAARQLPLWHPTLARDSYREVPRFADLEPGAAIYDDTDSFDAVTFGRALRRSNGSEMHRLGGPEPRLERGPMRPLQNAVLSQHLDHRTIPSGWMSP